MKRLFLCTALLIAGISQPSLAADSLTLVPPSKPDLVIKTYAFAKSKLLAPAKASFAATPKVKLLNNKKMKVFVRNVGKADSRACRLQLTVRRINGISVGRTKVFKVPPLAAGKGAWILVDATSLLPKTVALKDTTFRLDVDSTDLVNESIETNNRKWHNL